MTGILNRSEIITKSHEVIHSSKKPHCCEVCGQRFNQKISLRKHLPCYNTKPTETKATEGPTDQTISENKSSERWRSNEISESRLISENYAEPNCALLRNATEEYLGCRCPPSCACENSYEAPNCEAPNCSHLSRNALVLSCTCCTSYYSTPGVAFTWSFFRPIVRCMYTV